MKGWRFDRRGRLYLQGPIPAKVVANIIYVIAFNDRLVKVGRTTNWKNRRKSLTHHASLDLVGEAIFHIETEQDLADAEGVALQAMRDKFQGAGGNEFFKARFDEAFLVVQAALVSVSTDCIMGADRPDASATRGPAMSETTGDQLDAAIRRFCLDHGVSSRKVINHVGAGDHTEVIKRTGLIPEDVERRMLELMARPAALYERAS